MVVVYSEEQEAKFLTNLGYRGIKGLTVEQFNQYAADHPFYRDYDQTPELREKHDSELREWRERRDRVEVKAHSSLMAPDAKGSKSKTDQELWKELENTYPLEPSRVFDQHTDQHTIRCSKQLSQYG